MARPNSTNRYYAEDKDILDVLLSAKQRMTSDRLREMAVERGIITSPLEDRDELAAYISVLPHGWPELAQVLAAVESAERSPRFTAESVQVAATASELQQAADAVRQARGAGGNEAISIVQADGRVRIALDYTEIDSTKTRLRQNRLRHIEITLTAAATTVELRRHENDRAAEVTDQVLAELERLKAVTLERRRVDLTGVSDPALRTKFFTTLIRSVPGFGRVTDVSSVDVDRFAPVEALASSADELDVDDESAADEDLPSDDDVDDEETATEDPEVTIAKAEVRRILIRGGDLLQTPEFQRLKDSGFFVTEVRWTVARDTEEPVEVTFEAGFGDPVAGSGFAYKVSGVRTMKKDKKLRRTKKKPGPAEMSDYARLLEQAAATALEAVTVPAAGSAP